MAVTTETRFLNLLKRLRTIPFLQLPEDISLSRSAITLISWVENFPGSGVVDIANGLGLSAPTISVAIRRLVNDGWLERRRDPQDGRSLLIFLTPKGQSLMKRFKAHQKKIFEVFLSALNLEEQNLLLDLLEQALETIDDHVDDIC